jgi:hypothetical protein
MKISIFVPIGEKRIPRRGEYISGSNIDSFLRVEDEHRCLNYPIYILHEIEVPEGEDWLYYRFNHGKRWASIRMPRPKVKKWYIEITSPKGRVLKLTDPYTDESISDIMCDFPYAKCRKVSMIEVEE